jgi:hypothetical protein
VGALSETRRSIDSVTEGSGLVTRRPEKTQNQGNY